jgi:DNA-binding Xre family transcriptional regulator
MFYRKKRGNLKPDQSTILLDLKPILMARNIIHPSAYLMKMGINSQTVTKMLSGRAVQLNFKQLTKLCVNLNCTPNDIFALRDMSLPNGHALNTLHELNSPLVDINQWLQGKTVEEIRAILKG